MAHLCGGRGHLLRGVEADEGVRTLRNADAVREICRKHLKVDKVVPADEDVTPHVWGHEGVNHCVEPELVSDLQVHLTNCPHRIVCA